MGWFPGLFACGIFGRLYCQLRLDTSWPVDHLDPYLWVMWVPKLTPGLTQIRGKWVPGPAGQVLAGISTDLTCKYLRVLSIYINLTTIKKCFWGIFNREYHVIGVFNTVHAHNCANNVNLLREKMIFHDLRVFEHAKSIPGLTWIRGNRWSGSAGQVFFRYSHGSTCKYLRIHTTRVQP